MGTHDMGTHDMGTDKLSKIPLSGGLVRVGWGHETFSMAGSVEGFVMTWGQTNYQKFPCHEAWFG